MTVQRSTGVQGAVPEAGVLLGAGLLAELGERMALDGIAVAPDGSPTVVAARAAPVTALLG